MTTDPTDLVAALENIRRATRPIYTGAMSGSIAIQRLANIDAIIEEALAAYRAHPRSDRAVTADDLLEWFRARPGASWVYTIADIERAVAEIRGEPIPTYPPEAGK